MKWLMKRSYREVIAFVPLILAFWAIIPEVQSSPLTEVRFLPRGVVGPVLFAVAAILGKGQEASYVAIAIRGLLFFVFAYLVYERVCIGIL